MFGIFFIGKKWKDWKLSTNRFGSFKNKYGHFTEDGFEFVVTRPDTPRPWTNIISNGDYGLVISQAGGGFSWRTHVSLNRLTRWNQDLIRDDWGKWLYLRDMENGQLRSLAFQPMQADYDSYQVRHGLGYTIFEQKKDDLETEWTVMAAMNDPVEIWKVSLKNRGNRQRKFQLSSYLEWNLSAAPDVNREFHKIFIETGYDAASHAILATKTLWEVPTKRGHWNSEWPYAGFHAVNEQVSGWDTSKDALIGRHGGFHNPRGIAEGKFTGSQGRFHDAVASLAVDITLEPGEEKTVVWLLGQVDLETMQDAKKKIAALIQRYGNAEDADSELLDIKRYWKTLTDQIRIETPHPSFDLLSNIWLKYQAISGHMWARTGYYQQSGAYGYRDQLQTSQVWLPIEPDRMLEHARLNARHQFK